MVVIITGCVDNDKSKNNDEELKVSQKIDGVTISIGDISLTDHKGDLDSEGNEADNGEYFMLDGKLMLSSDYELVVLPITFNNENNYSYYFGVGGWKAFLNTVKSENEFSLIWVTKELAGEVKPNTKGEGNLYIVAKKEQFEENDLILVYDFLNYDDEWQAALTKVIDEKLPRDEFKELYTPNRIEFKLKK